MPARGKEAPPRKQKEQPDAAQPSPAQAQPSSADFIDLFKFTNKIQLLFPSQLFEILVTKIKLIYVRTGLLWVLLKVVPIRILYIMIGVKIGLLRNGIGTLNTNEFLTEFIIKLSMTIMIKNLKKISMILRKLGILLIIYLDGNVKINY